MQMQEFFQMLQYLLGTNSIHILGGDFNFGSLIDHVYRKKTLMEEIFANLISENLFFFFGS